MTLHSQVIHFGDSSILSLSNGTVFYSNANSTTFDGALLSGGRLSLDGQVNFNGPLTIEDTLVTMGDASFNGQLTNNGVIRSGADLDFQ
ncbi:MAG: hypothetical protein HRT61_22925, partial [Ekhidna sp.]|nr:hypothetical protein [Ekhidna sp.]